MRVIPRSPRTPKLWKPCRIIGFFDDSTPRIDPVPADLAGQPAIFDLRAAVHHHLEAGGLGLRGCLVVADAELHPDDLRAAGRAPAPRRRCPAPRRRRGRCRPCRSAPARRPAGRRSAAEELLPAWPGLTGRTAKPLSSRYFSTKKLGLTSLAEAPTMAMVLHAVEDAAKYRRCRSRRDSCRRLRAYSPVQCGGRLPRKAPMPSSASRASMFSTITSAV